ncbi:rod shape-determining protein [Candidatus Nomurabacteria bacterium RIFCSPHIGHO2_02_FULL_38_15]|uniref:Cell shape-determining protein MreB n=1 Tax=Candidatus Nomurabacteria bacterium RIFCSPHIGHO2_02_FULL_38_15 TaxID=1801752 RepID=A0A1F6VQJ3_9BACT|nr:MAG: rod shape-determining protein [Candidatus Nomurabacteria bacterium RIFCSPHIGHO2_02_FULL_38_15]
MFKNLFKFTANSIGIDLGTANTLVYLKGHGIVINEPSVVVVNQKTGRIVAVGAEAKQMLGRTPAHLKTIRPLVDGVISDYEVTEEMLTYLINKANRMDKKLFRPKVVVGIPTGVTNVEARAVYDAARAAGARQCYLIEEPVAGALGVRLPIKDAVGTIVVDIGGGTTDIAVIASGGVVRSKNLRIAGDKLNADVLQFIRDEFKLIIGEKTAEAVKIAVGSAVVGNYMETIVRGRDILTGLPREVIVTDADIREAMTNSVSKIIDAISEVLETTPPEILADVLEQGIVLVGGGALIVGLDQLIRTTFKVPVYLAEDPLTAVARGTGIAVEDIDFYKELLIVPEYDRSI